MEQQFRTIADWLSMWPDFLARLMLRIGLPIESPRLGWTLTEVALFALALLLSVVIARITTPLAEERIRAATLRPRVLRTAAVILRRLQIIYFALFLWFDVVLMRSITWPSNSYFLFLAANLVTAWVLISILSRAIRTRSLARVVEVGGWVLVALSIVGVLPQAMALLDSVGVTINDIRFSLLTVVQSVIVLSTLVWGATVLSHLAERQLSNLDDLTPSMQVLVGKITRFSLIVMAVMIGLYMVGVDFTALTVISGAIGVGLGFGLQKVVSNLVSGIILLLDKSIKPGDVITVGDTFGWITSLNARYASVSMRDGREILIPNEDLITQQVQNWSFENPYVRLDIHFGVSYQSDPHEVRRIAVEAASAHPRIVTEPPYRVVCHITGFGDSSIDFILRFFIADPSAGLTNVRGDVFLALWDAFKANGISIPYPHREVFVHETRS